MLLPHEVKAAVSFLTLKVFLLFAFFPRFLVVVYGFIYVFDRFLIARSLLVRSVSSDIVLVLVSLRFFEVILRLFQTVTVVSELIRLREEKLGLDTLILHEDRNIERLRRVAGQQSITAPMISSLGAGSGVLNTIGYYGYRQQPRISNRLGFAGDATIIPAEVVALIATPAAAIAGYRYEHKLKRNGEHPEQLLSTRLEDLKTLEKLVIDAWQ